MKKQIIVVALTLVIILAFVVGYTNYQKNKKLKEQELMHLYYQQNRAFVVYYNMDTMSYYQGSDNLNLPQLAMSLYVYSVDEPNKELTMQEVIDYFSEEYAEDGTLQVYNRPENIVEYLEWWYDGGSGKIEDFKYAFVSYMSETGGDYKVENYSLEELQGLFPLVGANTNR